MNLKERLINGLYGQAVLDSCGNPFEFMLNIDPDAVIKYADSTDSLIISDDSQMALFGFQAISDLQNFGNCIYRQVKYSFMTSYCDWYITQVEKFDETYKDIGLLSFESMWDRQAPGYTCLSALKAISTGNTVHNDSKGCGSVMRLLPLVSLFDPKYSLDLDEVIKLAQITGNITHKHKENDLAISRYIADAYSVINGNTPVNRYPHVTDINKLGDGWTALSCVEMAIWCYHNSTTFDELLRQSIAIDGDSDSVAAVAGSIWGLSGREVPEQYIAKLNTLDPIKYVISLI